MKMTKPRTRVHQVRKGVVAVEFAMTAPLLFVLLCAAVEFSRINMIRNSVDNAAYEGARRGIVPGATTDDVREATQRVLDIVYVRGATLRVTPAVLGPQVSQVTVSVDIPIRSNGWIAPMFFNEGSLTSSCTLAREQFEAVIVP